MFKHTVSGCQFLIIVAMLLLLSPVRSPLDENAGTTAAGFAVFYGSTTIESAHSELVRVERPLARVLRRPVLMLRCAFTGLIADVPSIALEAAAHLPLGGAAAGWTVRSAR